ncbi:hypothetical protein Tco_1474585 [Tanacetum coccineum]
MDSPFSEKYNSSNFPDQIGLSPSCTFKGIHPCCSLSMAIHISLAVLHDQHLFSSYHVVYCSQLRHVLVYTNAHEEYLSWSKIGGRSFEPAAMNIVVAILDYSVEDVIDGVS